MTRMMMPTMLLALVAFPAAAQVTPTPKPADEKVICHTDETLGTRLKPRKTCMTAKQWRESGQDATDWMNKKTQESGVRFPG